MRTLDIELLRTLDAIATQSTFAAAALHMHKTQFAVTQQMQRLKAETGNPLFEKHGRSKRLSPQAQQLLAYARRILALNDQAVQAMSQRIHLPSLRIGASCPMWTTS